MLEASEHLRDAARYVGDQLQLQCSQHLPSRRLPGSAAACRISNSGNCLLGEVSHVPSNLGVS